MGCTGSRKDVEPPQIVLFGDSLTAWSFDAETEGLGWWLEGVYGGCRVVNEGFAGYTSHSIKPEFTRIISEITAPAAPPTLLLTIFLGANDACLISEDKEYVPLPAFTANIRGFVDTILSREELVQTKVLLITPPPINIPPAPPTADARLAPEVVAAAHEAEKKGRAYRTYMSKRRYANRVMEIAGEYAGTGRVAGHDFWTAVVREGMREQGREDEWGEEGLPGCGLRGARAFEEGWFADGLHLDVKGYRLLSKTLMEVVERTWPELAPEKVGV